MYENIVRGGVSRGNTAQGNRLMCYIVYPGGLARSDDFLALKTAVIFSDQDFKCFARDQLGLVRVKFRK